jgi:hypothetical protein
LESWEQWLSPYSARLLASSSSPQDNYLRGPEWDYPVSQNYFWSYPLVDADNWHHQRNVQPNIHTSHQRGDYGAAFFQDALNVDDPLQVLDEDVFNKDTLPALQEATLSMRGSLSPPQPDPPGEETVGSHTGHLTFSFAENFFANPFAVSFPGDLPCPTGPTLAPIMDSSPCVSPPSDQASVDQTPGPSITPFSLPRMEACKPLTPRSTVHTPSSLNNGVTKSKPKAASTQPPMRYGHQIEFVDMADKKEAQRIRNTMNSRKHRQNKLEKIRELEKKLAVLEAEKEKWQGKADAR